MSVVWSDQVDKTYDCKVERVPGDAYRGVLTVKLGEETILSKEVYIAYCGPMGPDALDVYDWCVASIIAADKHKAENKK